MLYPACLISLYRVYDSQTADDVIYMCARTFVNRKSLEDNYIQRIMLNKYEICDVRVTSECYQVINYE